MEIWYGYHLHGIGDADLGRGKMFIEKGCSNKVGACEVMVLAEKMVVVVRV